MTGTVKNAVRVEHRIALRRSPAPAGPAQDIYQVFKHAWVTHADDVRQEEIAHRVAWSAVKKKYQKVGDEWVLMTSAALHGRDLGA